MRDNPSKLVITLEVEVEDGSNMSVELPITPEDCIDIVISLESEVEDDLERSVELSIIPEDT